MSGLSVVVPSADLEPRARAVLGDDAEVVVAGAGFPALQAALRETHAPVVVVVAGAQDPLELVVALIDKLEVTLDLDAVLAARPRGAWRTRLAQLVATCAPVAGANGTCAMRRALVDRVAAVRLARADLPALFARLEARTDVIRDARTTPPAARPSLALTGAAAQWLGLGAVIFYLLGFASFMVLPPGAARVANLVTLALCALVGLAAIVVHVRVGRAVRVR